MFGICTGTFYKRHGKSSGLAEQIFITTLFNTGSDFCKYYNDKKKKNGE